MLDGLRQGLVSINLSKLVVRKAGIPAGIEVAASPVRTRPGTSSLRSLASIPIEVVPRTAGIHPGLRWAPLFHPVRTRPGTSPLRRLASPERGFPSQPTPTPALRWRRVHVLSSDSPRGESTRPICSDRATQTPRQSRPELADARVRGLAPALLCQIACARLNGAGAVSGRRRDPPPLASAFCASSGETSPKPWRRRVRPARCVRLEKCAAGIPIGEGALSTRACARPRPARDPRPAFGTPEPEP